MTAPLPLTEAPGTNRRASRRVGRYYFLVPAGLFVALFSILPLITLVRMSLSHVRIATLNAEWPFAGLDNFIAGFASGATNPALVRTLVFVVVITLIGMVGGLAAAVALRTTGWWSSALLALMVFVWALPPVVNGSVWKFLLADEGLVNMVAQAILPLDGPLPFLYDQYWALASLALVNAWAVIPFNALVFRAALLGISPEVFEAATLDGASRWQEFRYIMIPAVRATTLVLLVLTIVFGFRSFDYIYVMTFGGPGTATNTLPFLSYMQAFSRYDFGLGAATSVLTVLIVLGLAFVYARSIRREEAH